MICIPAHKKNCVKEFRAMKCLPADKVGERRMLGQYVQLSFVLMEWSEILAIIFQVHASFRSFLTLRKEQSLNSFTFSKVEDIGLSGRKEE